MARDKLDEAAYDLSLFEPQKRVEKKKKEKSNLIRLHAKKNAKSLKRKTNPVLVAGVTVCTAAVTAVCAWIVCNNVMINELSQQIADANSEIVHQDNLTAEYQVRIDAKLTASMIEDYATEKLNMSQVQTAQKKFISLSDGDVGNVIRDDGTNTVLDSLKNMFSGV